MRATRALLAVFFVAIAGLLAWVLFVGVPRLTARRAPAPQPPVAVVEPPGRKIKAKLFFVSESGEKLIASERDVAYGEGAAEQAKAILEQQIAPSTEPFVSAVPPGTTLRAIYVAPGGEAYVDFSGDLAKAHPGGTLNELLTVYTIVDALAVNLPAVSSVQILIDGKEVDTLAGHIDLRRPLAKNLDLVE